ncbi:hypothetical protein D3C80_1799610 [compost metagenome]
MILANPAGIFALKLNALVDPEAAPNILAAPSGTAVQLTFEIPEGITSVMAACNASADPVLVIVKE